jgi:hypothetical protein
MENIKVSIKYAAPMFRIRIEEPDGSISVYGGRSVEEARTKLVAGRKRLAELLSKQGLTPDPWESDLLNKVDQHVSEFHS